MESRQENGPKAEKGEDRGSNRTGQNNKTADIKRFQAGGRHQKYPAPLRNFERLTFQSVTVTFESVTVTFQSVTVTLESMTVVLAESMVRLSV